MSPPGAFGRGGRGRTDRAYDRPAFPLEEVLALVRDRFVVITGKAKAEAARYLNVDAGWSRAKILEVLRDLSPDEWYCRQVREGRWVDIYRVEFDPPPPAWIKLKIEAIRGNRAVLVISFHEFLE